MQTDSKDYLVQLNSDVSAIIIQEPGCFAAKDIKSNIKIGYSHFSSLKNSIWKYLSVSNLRIFTCY